MFAPGKSFQDSIVFAGKAGAYPSEAPFKCSILEWAPGLAHKQSTSMERLAKNKHSSLLRIFVNYGQKKFYNIGPGENCTSKEVLPTWPMAVGAAGRTIYQVCGF